MEEFIGYFHVNETTTIYRSLGYIHDTFVQQLPNDTKIYVAWNTENQDRSLRYHVKIESPFDDHDRIRAPFRMVIDSFGDDIRLGVLLGRGLRNGYTMIDMVDCQSYEDEYDMVEF